MKESGYSWQGGTFEKSRCHERENFQLTRFILEAKMPRESRLCMAAIPLSKSRKTTSRTRELISFEEAMEKLSRDDLFRATIYAMNTLLVQKGVYSPKEFELHFRQFAQKQLK